MVGALRLILALTGQRAGVYVTHAKARAAHLAMLAAFGTAAGIFLLALITVALAQWLGVLAALAILAAICVLGCLGVLLAMRAERRMHQAVLAQQAREERRQVQATLLTALPGVRRGGVVAAGLAAFGFLLATQRSRRRH